MATSMPALSILARIRHAKQSGVNGDLFDHLKDIIKQHLHQIKNKAVGTVGTTQYDHLLSAVGDAEVVLLGGQTHGTKEFYHHKAEITRQLIDKKGYPERLQWKQGR